MSRWLLCRRRRPEAATRLYCFPHSGGAAGEYLRWADRLPGVEVWGVQPPGRGGRTGEPAFTSMDTLVAAFADAAGLAAPYTFFGHSLGALVAYEAALTLRERGLPEPEQLIVSAYGAPHLHRPGEPVADLDDGELLDVVEREHGPLPGEVRADPELAAPALAGLRADLTVVAAYRHHPAEPLRCPITALGGTTDEVTPAELAAWSAYTAGHFSMGLFPGGHFYFRERPDDLMGFLAERL
ncbi:thioesterase II family protein [Nonomuraea typhae]|uniref:Thioesterase II family protein n=1 Tax=Nonomuraea typhae TaxID=2603600 RepID=A0ABW7YUS2_9ACTN